METVGGETWYLYHAWKAKRIGTRRPGRVLLLDRVYWNPVTLWPSIGTPSTFITPAPDADKLAMCTRQQKTGGTTFRYFKPTRNLQYFHGRSMMQMFKAQFRQVSDTIFAVISHLNHFAIITTEMMQSLFSNGAA